jgi:CBS domain containing-hemolysin-like protein
MILQDILLIIILIALNGFFVGVEFAAVTSRRVRISLLAEEGSRSAKIVLRWLENSAARDRVIAASQLGITIVSLLLGAVGENTFEALLSPYFESLTPPLSFAFLEKLVAALPLIISLTIITTAHVVLGEQVPKIAILNAPEKFALFAARPMDLFMKTFRGFVSLLDWFTRGALRLFGVNAEMTHGGVYTVEELKQIVSGPETEGVIQEPQREMLSAIFDFGKLIVRQVMIPRTEIVAIEAETPLREVAAMLRENQYTKFPVYEGNLDRIVGVLHVKDLLNHLETPPRKSDPARMLMREALFVPETISVNALLHQFRDARQHIAIVLDEYGGTAGLVTLEDLLEEIIGDVQDQFDAQTPPIQFQPDGSALIDGLTMIEYVNQQIGLNLHDENYDTIAGFLIGKLGKIPAEGDFIEVPEEGIRLEVVEMDNLRVARLKLVRVKP